MSQNSLIEVLEAKRLLRSPAEVALFEQTLEKLAQNPDSVDLPNLRMLTRLWLISGQGNSKNNQPRMLLQPCVSL
ncbi:MAG: hypothetical protein HC866_05340 [Leptolyngbyaceae cyanobacterium RU_5_1]|nr:hypothetical protein [Leptolyngbyaceae cyanobacterium RU_5_1]